MTDHAQVTSESPGNIHSTSSTMVVTLGSANAVCRVCGGSLTPPISHCSMCASPHHRDCWEYNGGCAIYGCTGTKSAGSRALAVPDPAELAVQQGPSKVHPLPIVAGAFLLLGSAKLVGILPALAAIIALGLWARPRLTDDEGSSEAPEAPVDSTLALEKKAVSSLVGASVTDQLAQAYALFEQRHPKDVIDSALQSALAIELLNHGHRVLGLEALDKALRLESRRTNPDLERRRRETLLGDPAFFEEVVTGLGGPSRLDQGTLRGHVEPFAQAIAEAPRVGPLYILSATARGLGLSFRRPVTFPGPSGKKHMSQIIAGPFEPDAIEAEAQSRLGDGHPIYVVPAASLVFPSLIEPVVQIQLSQKGVRFKAESPMDATLRFKDGDLQRGRRDGLKNEEHFDWSDVVAVFFGRVDSALVRTVTEESVHRAGRHTHTSKRSVEKEDVRTFTVVELHVGSPLRRLRLDEPIPGMYDYLGRRKDVSHAFNLGLVTKDIVRFGPSVRASHGVHCFMGDRTGIGLHFSDPVAMEDYQTWFHAMGSDAVLSQWSVIRGPLEG